MRKQKKTAHRVLGSSVGSHSNPRLDCALGFIRRWKQVKQRGGVCFSMTTGHRPLRAERGLAGCHRYMHKPTPASAVHVVVLNLLRLRGCMRCVVRIHMHFNSVTNNNTDHNDDDDTKQKPQNKYHKTKRESHNDGTREHAHAGQIMWQWPDSREHDKMRKHWGGGLKHQATRSKSEISDEIFERRSVES